MRKVLIISPHFPPTNAPDMQRVRLALPWLKTLGWEPVVLAVAPKFIEGGVNDPLLEKTYPEDIRVIRVQGIPSRFTRWAHIGSLWFRCGRALRRAGEKLLASERFDLVFFSTTQFDAFKLGPIWKRRFGVPYLLDYQDPWFTDYYRLTGTPPPGGRLKFALAQWRARRHEPAALREAAGLIAVSGAYGPMLARNYPGFDASSMHQLPFGAAESDIELARNHTPLKPLVPFGDGCFHHVYTGRCGPDMLLALTLLFRAFKSYKAIDPETASRMHFHFIGTDYAPPPLGRESVMPVAKAEGVADHVHEHCYRVPYFDSLHYLTKADALVVIGSDDPSYSASKIFPYILARRPMLMIFHQSSPALAFAEQAGCGLRFGFSNEADTDKLVPEINRRWFLEGGLNRTATFDKSAFAPFTAESMTRLLGKHFDNAVSLVKP